MGAKSLIFNLITKYDGSGAEKAVKGLDKVNKKINAQLKEHGKTAALGAGAAAGGAFVAGLTSMIEMDNTRGKLEAQLGLTKDQSKRIGSVAGSLYASAYGDSMEDVSTAVKAVIQNMEGMKDASAASLKETSAAAMDVATVMGEDVGPVTVAVAQMMKTGLAKNAKEAFDILVAGTQKGANKAEDLLDTFNEYSTQFRKLGLDGQTAMGLIQQGLKGGARDSDIVADALKEFSIRAVDGSKKSAQGFKDLGLNAEKMSQQIGKGGTSAAAGLDTVLDRIRGIKDPVKQAAVATSLFGTQWEDMGAAFLSMDPSSAVSALGQVTDSADKAGKALGDTASSKFTAFKRGLIQDVQNAIGSTVMFMEKHTTTAKALGIAVGTLTAAWAAYNVVAGISAFRTALMTEGTKAFAVKTAVMTAVTKAQTAAQWLWNAAQAASPLTWIIIGLVALGVALFVAYKKSSTFRAIVQETWAAIKSAFSTAWNFIKPILTELGQWLVGKLVPVFKALWTAVKVVWAGISAAISAVWPVIKAIFTAIVTVIKTYLIVYFNVLKNVIKIVWILIAAEIKIAWIIIKAIFMAIKAVIQGVLAPVFRWLLNNVIKPVWGAIKTAIQIYWAAIKVIFNAVKAFIQNVLAPVFRWLLNNVIKPVWNAIKTAISTVWNSGIKPTFDAIKTAVGKVKEAFGKAAEGIKTAWEKVKGYAKAPIKFVIDTVYNNGIRSFVNGIADFAFGKGKGPRLDYINFARGGVMPGYAPGKDTLLAAVSPGESIFRPEFTRAVGSGWVSQANDVARRNGSQGVKKWMSGGGHLGGEGMKFARGGVVPFAGHYADGGTIPGFLKGLGGWLFDAPEKIAKSLLNKITGASVPGSGLFRDVVAGVPKRVAESVWEWVKKHLVGGGGKGMAQALNWAKSQSGKPYIWGGVGPNGYDCSGFMSAITNVIHGKSPYSRLFSTHSFDGSGGPGGFIAGLRSGFQVGVTNAGVGHMAGTLLGVNVESNGSQGVHYGPGARGARDSLFGSRQYGLKADTGALMLRPGWNPPTYNGTRRPELLMTRRPADGGINIHNHGIIGSQAELDRWVTRTMERLRRQSKLPSASGR